LSRTINVILNPKLGDLIEDAHHRPLLVKDNKRDLVSVCAPLPMHLILLLERQGLAARLLPQLLILSKFHLRPEHGIGEYLPFDLRRKEGDMCLVLHVL
jgi:hypothetical protein